MSNDQCHLFVHNFAYFSFFIRRTILSKYLNKFKLHHLYMYLYLCVWINLYNIIIIPPRILSHLQWTIPLKITLNRFSTVVWESKSMCVSTRGEKRRALCIQVHLGYRGDIQVHLRYRGDGHWCSWRQIWSDLVLSTERAHLAAQMNT